MRRKTWWLALCLGALLLLSGCRREMMNEPLTLRIPGVGSALFTGVVEDGLGEGTLTFEDWTYTGTFLSGKKGNSDAFLTGTAENYPWTLVIAGADVPGRYSGPLDNGVAWGEGVFKAENGLVFTGTVFGQSAEKGSVTDLPYTVAFSDSRYTGLYTGELENGLPQGEAAFTGVNAARQRFIWEGGWDAGTPSGEGELTADRLLTTLESAERAGSYQGHARDGLPQGQGVFSSVDGNGVPYTYQGEWENGLMNGQGTLISAAEDRYIRTGTFTRGSFTPTWIQALEVLGTREPCFSLTEAQKAFLESHPELWESDSHNDFYNSPYMNSVTRELSLWSCFQTPEVMAEPNWMAVYSLKVLDCFTGPAFPGGPVMTRITGSDRNYEYVVRILVPGIVDGIACNQWVSFVGVPLALGAYTTVLGQPHDCLVMVAGDLTIVG